jgi:hypothetical protein
VEPAAPGTGGAVAPDSASSLAPAQRSPIDAPAPATPDPSDPSNVDDGRSVAFDLRGPDDEPLERGVVFFEGDRPHDRGAPAPRAVQRTWRRAAPRLALPAWTTWIRAEADSVDDDLVNFDLASDPEAFDRAVSSERDGPQKTLRLHRRPGIFGQVRGVETTPCSVLCRPKRPRTRPVRRRGGQLRLGLSGDGVAAGGRDRPSRSSTANPASSSSRSATRAARSRRSSKSR